MAKKSDSSNLAFYTGLAGCFALTFGVFAPLLSAPVVGTMNYFQGGEGDGVIILALAGISVILILANVYKALYITALSSLGIMIYTYTNLQGEFGNISDEFGGLGDIATDMIEFSWGWAVLLIGVVLLIVAAAKG